MGRGWLVEVCGERRFTGVSSVLAAAEYASPATAQRVAEGVWAHGRKHRGRLLPDGAKGVVLVRQVRVTGPDGRVCWGRVVRHSRLVRP